MNGNAELKGCALTAAGGLFTAVALFIGVEDARFMAVSQTAPGVVYATPYGGSHPQIRFMPPGGRETTFPGNGLIWGYKVGDRVQVRYDPADPYSHPKLNSIGAIWMLEAIMGVMGLFFIWTGFGLMRSLFRRRKADWT